MAIVLNGTTGITAPDISVTAQSTDISSTGDITAVDATLSGGVYLGGTGAANYLDDYEEGTWTPDINTGSVATVDRTAYTKIGNLVTVSARMTDLSDFTSANSVIVNGLPFAITAGITNPAAGAVALRYYTSSGTQVTISPVSSTTTFGLLSVDIQSGANWVEVKHSAFSAIWDLQFTFTYFTDS